MYNLKSLGRRAKEASGDDFLSSTRPTATSPRLDSSIFHLLIAFSWRKDQVPPGELNDTGSADKFPAGRSSAVNQNQNQNQRGCCFCCCCCSWRLCALMFTSTPTFVFFFLYAPFHPLIEEEKPASGKQTASWLWRWFSLQGRKVGAPFFLFFLFVFSEYKSKVQFSFAIFGEEAPSHRTLFKKQINSEQPLSDAFFEGLSWRLWGHFFGIRTNVQNLHRKTNFNKWICFSI